VGNLGPLLGLIGTVMGMIFAFSAMQKAQGQASPADLADGISKALVHHSWVWPLRCPASRRSASCGRWWTG